MSSEVILRPAVRADVPVLFDLIKALAEYEKLSDAVTGSGADLENHLFGDRPFAEAILAECEGRVVGWALFFHNYSTFLTQPGIYVEDLFVLPELRGRGIGKSLIVYLANLTVERGCGRLEWSVLDWNELAIGFYKGIGADVMPDWRICRVAGKSLASLASK
ncbi:MAG: GNAT family N-acetyltransferase [Microcoleus sp. CSU_2_2]|nr:GNAT family N-acetyltransferase [Microcoleus sp. SU_5_3]NJS08962.1 GNAT family N-acetyltransferase [Microcoleus sp. CSU_2_2]